MENSLAFVDEEFFSRLSKYFGKENYIKDIKKSYKRNFSIARDLMKIKI